MANARYPPPKNAKPAHQYRSLPRNRAHHGRADGKGYQQQHPTPQVAGGPEGSQSRLQMRTNAIRLRMEDGAWGVPRSGRVVTG